MRPGFSFPLPWLFPSRTCVQPDPSFPWRKRRRPTAAALTRPGGAAPRDPLTRALGLLVFWWDVGAAVWGVGRVVVGAMLFGVWVIGEAVFWRSPNAAPLGRHWGSSAYSGGGLRHIAAARGSARS